MSHFSKMIYYYPDLCEAGGFWKLSDEVHGDRCPGHVSQFQGLEKAIFFVMLRHVILTRVTGMNVIIDRNFHIEPVSIPV